MVFNSAVFLYFFFPAVFLLSRVIPSRRGRQALLCAASLVFYAFGGPGALPLLLLSALVNWLLGLRLGREGGRRRALCALGIALNLGVLAVCKYLDFFTGTLNALLGTAIPSAGLALPLGVSFFTFQSVSYLADVCRAPERAARRFGDLLLYLAFFPRSVAGPLVRWDDFTAQLGELRFTAEDTAAGLRRFVRGLAKKVLLADLIAAAANAVFAADRALLTPQAAWLGAVAYTLQLYFDFSGYSDMAIGLGRCFGFALPENFNYPYTALTVTEFWRRWHITLSRWFRDYVYIPLGGNRRGTGRTALNKLCVFLLTGLWHGAAWTFVLWGLWHGLFMMLESAARPFLERARRSPFRFLLSLYTMLVVILGFVLFRASSASDALGLIARMFGAGGVSPEARRASALLARETLDGTHTLALFAGVLFAFVPVVPALDRRLPDGPAGELIRDGAALALFVLCLLAMAGSSFTPFIYAQF